MLTQYWHNWASDGRRTKGNRFDNFLVLRQSQLHYAMHTDGGGEAGERIQNGLANEIIFNG